MIEFDGVTKRYGGTVAIDDLRLRISENGIYCLLGRNGAGKTTLMKLLAGHIAAASGKITAFGQRVSPGHMPESVNYLDRGSAQFNMRVSQLIDTAAELQESFDRGFAREMADRFGLDPQKKYKQLSFGMKTMLTTIILLANNSSVILLDEPTLGFDAVTRDQLNTLLLESYHAHPRVIVVSTQLIDEIAKAAERLIIIKGGRILLTADIGEIDEKAYTLSGPAKLVLPLLDGLNCVGKTAAGSVMAAHIYDGRITPPEGVALSRLSLQDFFINIVGGTGNE
ncbi:MAG: ABC transporter ATP-binding protein [Gracilibacteraceae bacterium]|jgi:ABC-2 type transport system ATP-binding protein|nr:ABC transporter ATP-binding protein [Gracilibacteraceae bacterium]